MSDKVLLHIYEKTQRSKKRVDRALTILAGTMIAAVVSGILYLLGTLVVAFWMLGAGGWLMGIGAFFGGLVYAGIRGAHNDRILADAEAYGVVDE